MTGHAAIRDEPPRRQRSILLHGLWLVFKRPRPVIFSYLANVGVALAFTASFYNRLSGVLDHSLAAERLNGAFDLGTLGALLTRLDRHSPGPDMSSYLGVPVYLAIYFVIVPGAIFCYAADTPCRLSIMLSMGLTFLKRFLRITLLTMLVSLLVLGPLVAAQAAWADWVGEHIVGWAGYWALLPGLIVLVLVASVLRLYFDLVEVYTVQLNEQLRPNGRPDRRVRKVLLPAWRTLWRNFGTMYLSWMALFFVGLAAFVGLSRVAVHTLAEPHAWPLFLLTQAGLLMLIVTRFWQRAAETVLVLENPLPAPEWSNTGDELLDAEPDPEPASPSLDGPDTGIYEGPPLTVVPDPAGRIDSPAPPPPAPPQAPHQPDEPPATPAERS